MAKSTFRVALNPRNPEAVSRFDPATGMNLNLSHPESTDLSRFNADDLRGIYTSIRHGVLIVVEGDLPDEVSHEDITPFAAPRSRWDHEDPEEKRKLQDAAARAVAHWDEVLSKSEAKGRKVAEKTA